MKKRYWAAVAALLCLAVQGCPLPGQSTAQSKDASKYDGIRFFRGASPVELYGEDFGPRGLVTVGGKAATVKEWSSSEIKVELPEDAAGAIEIVDGAGQRTAGAEILTWKGNVALRENFKMGVSFQPVTSSNDLEIEANVTLLIRTAVEPGARLKETNTTVGISVLDCTVQGSGLQLNSGTPPEKAQFTWDSTAVVSIPQVGSSESSDFCTGVEYGEFYAARVPGKALGIGFSALYRTLLPTMTQAITDQSGTTQTLQLGKALPFHAGLSTDVFSKVGAAHLWLTLDEKFKR